MANERIWIGVDPGGRSSFGLAMLRGDATVRTTSISCALEALEWIEDVPDGAGIDAPMWWSSGLSGDRQADRWIRRTYGIRAGTVQATNSLQGACLVQGVLFAEGLRRRYPHIHITEAHPKAVLRALGISHDQFFSQYGVDPDTTDEHERDAVIAAVAAREGFSERWPRDLALERLESEQDPSGYWLAPMHYFWPETDEESKRD